MPKVMPGAGQAVEETTVTRIIPAAEEKTERISSDALEYMELCPAEKWASGNHMAYIYRIEPPVYRNTPGPTYVTKYSSPISLEQIQADYGGGLWRILVKRGNERMADRNYPVAGPARDLSRSMAEFSATPPNGAGQMDSSAGITPGGVVSKAMDMVGNTEAQRAQVDMVKSTATEMIQMVRETAPKQMSVQELIVLAQQLAPKANSFLESPLGLALATKLLDRIFADPTDQFIKMADIMTRLNGTSGASDWKSALVGALPQVANAVRDTVHEMAESQRNPRMLNVGAPPPTPPQAPPAPPSAINPNQNVVQMPAPQPPAPNTAEMIDLKLIELLSDPTVTGDKAGEILDATWPDFVDEVSKLNVDQLIMAFNARPLLKPHAANPRLREFLTQFLQWANETDVSPIAPKPVA